MNDTLKFTCKIGTFYFPKETRLSLAKLTRDTVMGQILNPEPRTQQINTAEDAEQFMRNSASHVLAGVRFKLEMA